MTKYLFAFGTEGIEFVLNLAQTIEDEDQLLDFYQKHRFQFEKLLIERGKDILI